MRHAIPFAISLTFPPVVALGAWLGGAWISAAALYALLGIPLADTAVRHTSAALDPATEEGALFWYRLLTWVWVPAQLVMLFGVIGYVGYAGELAGWELALLAFSLGIVTGGIGITYAHELMHQHDRFERGLAEVLMCSTLYGHFCIEHVHGHHIHVGTPRDPVSAREGESFFRFYPRTLIGSLASAWLIVRRRMEPRRRPIWSAVNPFWRYAAQYAAFLGLAYALAGWIGVAVFAGQALVALTLLEIINYVEHYGLRRQMLDNGRYERTQPHHSWNASHQVTNWLLINLQRHSDHLLHPSRRYPLLQDYPEGEAPQLPFGYPLMLMIAPVPPLWFRLMNPRVAAWRARHYPQGAPA
jgi:alkane 1-monooxygenase